MRCSLNATGLSLVLCGILLGGCASSSSAAPVGQGSDPNKPDSSISLGWPSDGGTSADASTAARGDMVVAGPPAVGVGFGSVGNSNGHCSAALPAKGQPVDVSAPTSVVGNGTAASCTFAELSRAVAKGGVITFDCGGAANIAITATLNLPTDRNTTIDGGHRITLDGQGAVRIFSFNSPNFQANENTLTLQHIALVNGKAKPTVAIPVAPPPCSQGWNDGEGGALYMRDGNLVIIDSLFSGNQAAPLGPDTGGGAIYILGSKHGALIVGSTFSGNQASNAGAVGGLFTELDIYNSFFSKNVATGAGANADDASKCSSINNGQHEVGSGGNGGALYSDGNSVNVKLCGDAILDNAAGTSAFGGGLFFTSNNMMGTLSIADTTMTGNSGGYWTNTSAGSVHNVGSAIGVNALSITVTSSTLQ